MFLFFLELSRASHPKAGKKPEIVMAITFFDLEIRFLVVYEK